MTQSCAALDAATMKALIQKELDSLRPWSTSAFMQLWAEGGTLCLEDGCYEGLESIEEVMSGFDYLSSMSCDILGECYFLEKINKAGCRFSCVASLKENPGCVSDHSRGVITYEWNDAGLIVRVDDFWPDLMFAESLIPCMKVDTLGSGRALTAEMNKKYPGYSGDVSTSGSVTVTFPTPGVTKFEYDLRGLEESCNGCGIHIHAGTSCDAADKVMGHFFAGPTDPWTPANGAVYNSDASGAAKGSFEMISGYDTYSDNLGRAVVIHSADGSRVSCSILEAGAGSSLRASKPALLYADATHLSGAADEKMIEFNAIDFPVFIGIMVVAFVVAQFTLRNRDGGYSRLE